MRSILAITTRMPAEPRPGKTPRPRADRAFEPARHRAAAPTGFARAARRLPRRRARAAGPVRRMGRSVSDRARPRRPAPRARPRLRGAHAAGERAVHRARLRPSGAAARGARGRRPPAVHPPRAGDRSARRTELVADDRLLRRADVRGVVRVPCVRAAAAPDAAGVLRDAGRTGAVARRAAAGARRDAHRRRRERVPRGLFIWDARNRRDRPRARHRRARGRL